MEENTIKMINIFLLGGCFCLVFTGFNTMGQTQALVFSSAENVTAAEGKTVFKVNGLVTNGIVYGVFAFASWLSPSIVVAIGPRISMIIAALTYAFQISQYLYLNAGSVYFASVLIGFGAPIIWTAQGTFLSNNSDDDTITRNSGIFWAMNMSSSVIGNLISYFLFQDQEILERDTWMTLGWILTSVTISGVLAMFLLRPTPWVEKKSKDEVSMLTTLRDSISLFTTANMLMFSVTMFFTGLNQSLWAGVYSGCIGWTKGFGPDRKSLASLSAILVAVGEVVGGVLFGMFASIFTKRGRWPIVVLGGCLSLLTYSFMFINFPMEANDNDETDEIGFIDPNKALALSTSFILGFSDSCFNTQVASVLGGFYKDQAASAFGIFKFVQSLASAISFFYSPFLGFHWQLLILAIFCVAGTGCFVKLDLIATKSASYK